MVSPVGDRETVLRAIETWPLEDQVALARAILRRSVARTAPDVETPQRPRWRQMAGLASNGQAPPSDEEVARWLDEHHTEKYG